MGRQDRRKFRVRLSGKHVSSGWGASAYCGGLVMGSRCASRRVVTGIGRKHTEDRWWTAGITCLKWHEDVSKVKGLNRWGRGSRWRWKLEKDHSGFHYSTLIYFWLVFFSPPRIHLILMVIQINSYFISFYQFCFPNYKTLPSNSALTISGQTLYQLIL